MSLRALIPDDLSLFRWVDHVRLSPSGEYLAYQVTWADVDARENRGRVIVAPAEPGSPGRELRAGVRRDHSPEWSPDGDHIAFLSQQGARDQLFVAPADGDDAIQLTTFPDGVLTAAWSPDGTTLAFAARVLSDPDAAVDDPRPPESEEQSRRPPIARVVRTLGYRRDGVGYFDGRHSHLFVVSCDGGEPTGRGRSMASSGRLTGAPSP